MADAPRRPRKATTPAKKTAAKKIVSRDPQVLAGAGDDLGDLVKEARLSRETRVAQGEDVKKLLETGTALVVAVANQKKRDRQWHILIVLMGAIVAIAVLAAVIFGYFMYSLTNSGRKARNTLIECTTPSVVDPTHLVHGKPKVIERHECFERSQKQLGKAIAQLGINDQKASAAAITCIQYQTVGDIYTCIVRQVHRLDQAHKHK